jgi:F-type H+-transporting ATPase subunit epsilon
MEVVIVSPDGKLLESQAEAVSLPGVAGSFQILNNHAPVVALLTKGTIRIKGGNIQVDEDVEDKFVRVKDELQLPVNGGTVEMKNNRLIILVD